ncbi:hypothetical protein GCM10022406_14330 [Hymenobacter algoricola]|uniref:Uncharacterized protein n=1 Tax=Hymenobacter algoricola TaxID=486267 RepID=A0ABP7MTW7_9BACT
MVSVWAKVRVAALSSTASPSRMVLRMPSDASAGFKVRPAWVKRAFYGVIKPEVAEMRAFFDCRILLTLAGPAARCNLPTQVAAARRAAQC